MFGLSLDQFVSIGLALYIGVRIATEDYRTGKIKNRWIIGGIAGRSLVLLLYFLYATFIWKNPSGGLRYVSIVLINAFLAFVFAFILWKLETWSAGDSKLFIVFSYLKQICEFSKKEEHLYT